MRNFYNICKFSTLTIHFSAVWPRQILDLDKQFNLIIRLKNVWRYLCKMSWRRLQNVLKTSWRCLENVLQRCLQHIFKTYHQDKLSEDFLKKFCRRFCKTSLICFEDVLKMLWHDTLKTSQKRLEDVLKISWIHFWKMSWRHLENVLKIYDQDEYIGLYQDGLRTSWGRLLKTHE